MMLTDARVRLLERLAWSVFAMGGALLLLSVMTLKTRGAAMGGTGLLNLAACLLAAGVIGDIVAKAINMKRKNAER